MKRIYFLSLLLIGMLFTSCNKNWNCECSVRLEDGEVSSVSFPIKNQKKSEAKENCKDKEKVISQGGLEYSCNLEK